MQPKNLRLIRSINYIVTLYCQLRTASFQTNNTVLKAEIIEYFKCRLDELLNAKTYLLQLLNLEMKTPWRIF